MISSGKYLVYIIFCAAMVFTSCEKAEVGGETENPQSSDPVFYTEIAFNGQSITFNAGDDDFFMYTIPPEPSDSLIIYSSVGKSESCMEDCEQEFRLEVYDSRPIQLIEEEYFFPFGGGTVLPQPSLGNFELFISSPTLEYSVLWSRIESDVMASDSISVLIEPHQMEAPEPILIDFNDVGSISILPANGFTSAFDCSLNVRGGINDLGEAMVSIITDTDANSAEIVWNDGTTGMDYVFNQNLSIISADIFLQGGCRLLLTINFLSQEALAILDLSFNMNFQLLDPEYMFSPGAHITYIDDLGNEYQSMGTGEMRIFDLEDYLPNENGAPTIQYSVEFSTILLNVENPLDFVDISDGKARLATLKK